MKEALYQRGIDTPLACWEHFAGGSSGASLLRLQGVSVAVFPEGGERSVYYNAVLERELDPVERRSALEAMEDVYAGAGIDQFAAWAHEDDRGTRAELEQRGYVVTETTCAMGMSLDDLPPLRIELDLSSLSWDDYLATFGLPAGLLRGVDRSALHVLVAQLGGAPLSTATSFEFAGDCGIYNVSTLEHARSRGLATAITSRLLWDARDRGCRTASLQSTEMAERAYTAAGFRDLGRIIEYGRPYDTGS